MSVFMTVMDFGLLVVLILSAFFAYNRGFSREIMAIGSWVGAAMLTKFMAVKLIPTFQDMIQLNELSASIAAYFTVFLVSIILFSYLVKKIARRLHATDLKSVDQALGFVFGLIRGVVMMCVFYAFMLWLIPQESNRPEWFLKARSRPMLRHGAHLLDHLFIPGSIKFLTEDINEQRDEIKVKSTYEKLLKPDIKSLEIDTQEDDDEDGYRESERQDLERQLYQIQALEKILEENE